MRILTDNDLSIKNQEVRDLLGQYGVKFGTSTMYYPQGNNQAKATNKTLLKMLSKTIVDNQKDWAKNLSETLWAYRTMIKKSTQATPYSLVYGQEAVLLVEIKVVSARIATIIDKKIRPEDLDDLLANKLKAVDEVRDRAAEKQDKYKQALAINFNRPLRPRSFNEGDKVLKTTLNVTQGISAENFAPT
ncbi:PREDICTED: uncharacterized protein LOC104587874 [Nelumbo nucifera]|uniref:Uncharacterized protein LOC104587874 n=1 Tax=Nelumbo nucifera TaxID=4432 RepID=A0A1U7YU94_NELNU|nr:PREDICTED: uncharacterized protein LOC104587874 [Nelumbo nucifera]